MRLAEEQLYEGYKSINILGYNIISMVDTLLRNFRGKILIDLISKLEYKNKNGY